MTREHIQHGLGWLGARFKHEVFAIKHHRNASRVCGAKGLGCTHSCFRQPGAACGEVGEGMGLIGG